MTQQNVNICSKNINKNFPLDPTGINVYYNQGYNRSLRSLGIMEHNQRQPETPVHQRKFCRIFGSNEAWISGNYIPKCRISKAGHCTQRNHFQILLKQPEIRLYFTWFGFIIDLEPNRGQFGSKINRKMVNTIRSRFDLTRFQKYSRARGVQNAKQKAPRASGATVAEAKAWRPGGVTGRLDVPKRDAFKWVLTILVNYTM